MTITETVGWILIALGLAVIAYCVLWGIAAIRDAARAADEATARIIREGRRDAS